MLIVTSSMKPEVRRYCSTYCDLRTFLRLISAPSKALDVWRTVKSVLGSRTVTLFWRVRCSYSKRPICLALRLTVRPDLGVAFQLGVSYT